MISQQFRENRIKKKLKTPAGNRQIDLSPEIAALLKAFIGDRKSGLLFSRRDGRPLSAGNLYLLHLHPALQEAGYVNEVTGNHKAGFHAFRRFRNTWLRNHTPCPEGLRKYWMGHEGRIDLGDRYDKIARDLQFRLDMAAKCGYGFDLPIAESCALGLAA